MLGKRVALGAAILAGLQLILKFVDVIALMVMARLLVPEDFGLVALAVSVQLIAGAVTELNVSDALVQRKKIDPNEIDTAFTLNLTRGVLVMLVMLTTALPMARIYDDERLLEILLVMAAVPVLAGIQSPALIHFLHRLEYGPTAKMQLFGKLGGVSISIAVGVWTRSYWALVVSQLAYQFVATSAELYRCTVSAKAATAGMARDNEICRLDDGFAHHLNHQSSIRPISDRSRSRQGTTRPVHLG